LYAFDMQVSSSGCIRLDDNSRDDALFGEALCLSGVGDTEGDDTVFGDTIIVGYLPDDPAK